MLFIRQSTCVLPPSENYFIVNNLGRVIYFEVIKGEIAIISTTYDKERYCV